MAAAVGLECGAGPPWPRQARRLRGRKEATRWVGAVGLTRPITHAPDCVTRRVCGLCREERTFTHCGTLHCMAPEMLRGDGHSFPVDWWSVQKRATTLFADWHCRLTDGDGLACPPVTVVVPCRALGVLLYEMLTGAPPFTYGSDAMSREVFLENIRQAMEDGQLFCSRPAFDRDPDTVPLIRSVRPRACSKGQDRSCLLGSG